MLSQLAALTAGRGSRWGVIGLWLVLAVSMAPLQGPLQERAADESDTFQVRGSESLAAKRLIDENFVRGSELAAVIAYVRDGGLTSEDRIRIEGDARTICRSGAIDSLTLVGTPYGLGCGEDDPLDLSPGRSLLIAPDNGLVQITATRSGNEVIVRVEDQGPGVPSDLAESIFRRFTSVRPEAEESHSGLGLAIARAIAEGHNGKLEVETRDQRPAGAAFILRLPAAGEA